MGKGDPEPERVDYVGLAQEQREAAKDQLLNNRPDIVTDFSKQEWTQNPDGTWTQATHLTGGVGEAVNNAVGGVAGMGQLDLSQYMGVGTGDQARDKMTESIYSQALSRLQPQQQQASQDLETQLANQGLQPGSEAYERARQRLSTQQTDANQTALNSAIMGGTQAGSQAFRDNLAGMGFQAGLAEKQHNAPLAQLQALSGFMAPMGFQADNSTLAGASGAAGTTLSGQQQAFDQWQATQGPGLMDVIGAVGSVAGAAGGMMMSDARTKTDVTYVGRDALPGVPFVSFRYVDGFGQPAGRFVGVMAQDLEKVAPAYVHRRSDGIMMVDYSFLEVACTA